MSTLKLITLPIGNAEDITLRAKSALESEAFFLAEDTRNLSKLLNHYGIDSKSKKIDSFHDHSRSKIEKYVEKIKRGEGICLVSDAGSPIISDPAFPLVEACLEKGVEIETLPGVSAVNTALELSGLPPHPFTFHGFLPRDKRPRTEVFKNLLSGLGTHIFFESPYRMADTLSLLSNVAPEAQVSVGRELTKAYESVYRFRARDWESANINFKGEFVLCIHIGKDIFEEKRGTSKIEELATNYMEGKRNLKALSKLLGEILDVNSKEIYSELSKK